MKYQLGERRVECRGAHFIAESASVIGSVVMEDDASVWFNAVVRGDNDLITADVSQGCLGPPRPVLDRLRANSRRHRWSHRPRTRRKPHRRGLPPAYADQSAVGAPSSTVGLPRTPYERAREPVVAPMSAT